MPPALSFEIVTKACYLLVNDIFISLWYRELTLSLLWWLCYQHYNTISHWYIFGAYWHDKFDLILRYYWAIIWWILVRQQMLHTSPSLHHRLRLHLRQNCHVPHLLYFARRVPITHNTAALAPKPTYKTIHRAIPNASLIDAIWFWSRHHFECHKRHYYYW
jgi:hypothetical protein